MRHSLILFFSIFILLSTSVLTAHSEWYPSEIVYQQAVTKILKRGDISWGNKTDNYYNFGSVQASAGGTKVLFTGICEFCDSAEVRPFLVSPDGSGLQDISSMLPSDITNRWSAWRNLLINDDASKVFFRAAVETGYYDDSYLYVYDVASSARGLAVNQKFGSFSSNWHFRINENGTRVYLDEYDAGSEEGLFYANTGGSKVWFFDVNDLSCASECGNLNLFHLMGVSSQNDLAFIHWNSDYNQTDGSNQHTGVWYTGLAGIPERITDEHYWIYDGDRRGISNTKGTRMIYRYKHTTADSNTLAVVSVADKTETMVGWTSGLNGFSSHMSRSGRYILVNGEYGDSGTYYQTMIDLATGKSRDTWSYYLPRYGYSTSNITEDDRYYFHSIDGYPNIEETVGLYRIDMSSTGDERAPHVQSIQFNSPALPDQDGAVIGVQVAITDPQGIGTLDWVRLLPLVEGQEDPSWKMDREPLAFPSGDPGSTPLYDNGTHGDALAGDGIYSFDSIATRKTGREGTLASNTWYQHYTLPSTVGIRIIVKDEDNNYCIADTELMISDVAINQVTLTSPSGTIEDTTPSFTWSKDPNATWYKLWIGYDSGEKIFAQWYETSDICSGESCSITIESQLAGNSYEWWVESWNDYDRVWSDGMTFVVQGSDTPPSKIIHKTPSGQTQDSTPAYTWDEDPASTWYKLWIGYDSGERIFAQWYEASTICSGGSCSVTLESELSAGNHSWWIKCWNDYGRIWSNGMNFTITE